MADNVTLNSGTGGANLATDDVAGVHYQIEKLAFGALDSATLVSTSNGLPVQQQGTWDIGDVTGTVSLPTGAATSAKQDTIIGHVDGIEGLLTTIDGDTGVLAAKTADFDTGAGTDTVALLGVALPASGGAVAGGTATNPIRTDPTGTTTQPVSDGGGSLTVDGTVTVQDGGGSLTVDAPVGTPVFVRLSDGTSAIATLPVSLASVPSHQVTNAGTFAVQATLQAGTNAVGKLAANSGVDIGDVDVTSQPARARTTDTVSAALATDALMSSTTALTPKFAAIDAATSGDNTIVAAVASKKIRVLSAFLVAAGTVNVRFESGAGGTALTGQMNLVANTGFVLPFNPLGWFETGTNTLLNIELSAAVSVDGSLTYVEV